MIIKKIKSFSHFREVSNIDRAKIEREIRSGNAQFNSDMFLFPVSIDKSFPKFIYTNKDKYENFILVQTKKEKFFCFINIIMKQPKYMLKTFIYSIVGKENLKAVERKIKNLFFGRS